VNHVLRRADLLELFDTTPDVFGNDIDVSRFIRQADDHDVQVFSRIWDGRRPDADRIGRPSRDELCPAPIGDVAKLTTEGDAQRRPWLWDHLQGEWRATEKRDIRPGGVFLLQCKSGCYSEDAGWDARSKQEVARADSQEPSLSEESVRDNPETFEARRWVPLSEHTASVVEEVERLLDELSDLDIPSEHRSAVPRAAIWHDVGKGHRAFQRMLLSQATEVEHAALANVCWAKSPHRAGRNRERPYFRHELASALVFLANHDGTFESDLAAYLIAAHHGRVRLAIRSAPGERPPEEEGRRFALGVWDGEEVPELELPREGLVGPTTLNLLLMEVGADGQGRPSWLQRSLRLREQLGPFRLAFLEALLRIADWRASAKEAAGGAR
jgi:CRISPR-associated endonuclease/helicase Cas3